MCRPLNYLKSPKSEKEALEMIDTLTKDVEAVLESYKMLTDIDVDATLGKYIRGNLEYLRDYIDTTPVNHKGQFTYLNGKLLKLY